MSGLGFQQIDKNEEAGKLHSSDGRCQAVHGEIITWTLNNSGLIGRVACYVKIMQKYSKVLNLGLGTNCYIW